MNWTLKHEFEHAKTFACKVSKSNMLVGQNTIQNEPTMILTEFYIKVRAFTLEAE